MLLLVALDVIPENWKSNGNDVIWLAAVLAAFTVIFGFLGRHFPALKRFPRWVWRRTWGRDEHGIWLTPTVRLLRLQQAAVAPQLAELSGVMEHHLAEFREENSQQHHDTAARIAGIADQITGLDERTVALEVSQGVTNERLAALEAAVAIFTKEH